MAAVLSPTFPSHCRRCCWSPCPGPPSPSRPRYWRLWTDGTGRDRVNTDQTVPRSAFTQSSSLLEAVDGRDGVSRDQTVSRSAFTQSSSLLEAVDGRDGTGSVQIKRCPGPPSPSRPRYWRLWTDGTGSVEIKQCPGPLSPSRPRYWRLWTDGTGSVEIKQCPGPLSPSRPRYWRLWTDGTGSIEIKQCPGPPSPSRPRYWRLWTDGTGRGQYRSNGAQVRLHPVVLVTGGCGRTGRDGVNRDQTVSRSAFTQSSSLLEAVDGAGRGQ